MATNGYIMVGNGALNDNAKTNGTSLHLQTVLEWLSTAFNGHYVVNKW